MRGLDSRLDRIIRTGIRCEANSLPPSRRKCGVEYGGNVFLPAQGHYVDASAQRADLTDGPRGNLYPRRDLPSAPGHALQGLDQSIRHADTRHRLIQPACHRCRFQRDDAGQNGDAIGLQDIQESF